MEAPVAVSFPKMIINVGFMGTNSLIGALCVELIKKDLMKDVGVLQPEAIVFVVGKTHFKLDIFEEICKVRDVFQIDEKKIKVYIATPSTGKETVQEIYQ